MAGLNTKGKMSITELDFDTIKGNLKTYLKGQTEFTDYDFEGSGMSCLLYTSPSPRDLSTSRMPSSA